MNNNGWRPDEFQDRTEVWFIYVEVVWKRTSVELPQSDENTNWHNVISVQVELQSECYKL